MLYGCSDLSAQALGKWVGEGLSGWCKAELTPNRWSLPSSTLLNRPSGCLAVEAGLSQTHGGVCQVHQPHRISNFYLVSLVGWCTRRQATLWLTSFKLLQCELYLVTKYRNSRCRKVARSLTRKGVLNPGARSCEKHAPGGWQEET